ncbi:MAG: bifunctional oligoribonuclease/PAP phosphatase NrnA [Treponema sp.]|jgi:phosphoesterase RecJ-like protein|nr:bifunctional oligoribonuclease/PAP phosphatase NrnA [Treponema sp.]
MQVLTKDQADAFAAFISSHDSFLIAGHKEPDGDCVSCCLGISYILKHSGKPFVMLNAGPFKRTEIKRFAPLFKAEVPFMLQKERERCGLIIADCSEIARLGDIEGDLQGFDTFIIDHHKTADAGGGNSIIDASSPAASLIVQQLYEALVGKPDGEKARSLFFGLATDTGFFRFLNQNDAEVFHCAARLVEAGTNPRDVYQEMTGGKAWNTRKLLGIMLERVERHFNGKLAVTYETQEDTKKYGQEGRDSDALYTLMLATEGVEAVLFVRQENEHNCTLGLRSKGDIDVSRVAAQFGGGGHKNASGASTEGKLDTLIPAILKEFAKIL